MGVVHAQAVSFQKTKHEPGPVELALALALALAKRAPNEPQ